VEHPFAVGDWIETASGVTGKVLDANWRAVHFVTIEGRVVVMPNTVLANNQFINLNALTDIFGLRRRFASITACPPNAWCRFSRPPWRQRRGAERTEADRSYRRM
jgi:Mechanosensitive ion channel